MLKMHNIEQPPHFERMAERWQQSNARGLALLQKGQGDQQAIYGGLCKETIDLGCIALILGEGDEVAREHFQRAAGYAIDWLRAPGSVGSPRVYDVNVEASEGGTRVTAIHERKPSREPAKHSLISYSEILFTTLSFGDAGQVKEVAEYPEEGYRNPNVVGSYEDLRVWRAWIFGHFEAVPRMAGGVLKSSPQPAVAASMSALLAILAGDQKAFEVQLEGHAKAHRKHYQRQPNDPRGVVSLGGLALCRLARERGLTVEDQPYLPVRLLPRAS